MTDKTSDAQKRASRKWEQQHKDIVRVQSYRRTAKLFIRTHADNDDLLELRQMIDERLKH